MDAYRCPKCAAEVGATVEEIDLQCWQCGLEFADEEGTAPVLKDKWAARTWLPTLRWVGAVLSPTFLYWLVIYGYAKLPFSIPSLGVFWIFPAAGLTLFGLCCALYALDRLHKADRGFAWLVKAVLTLLLFFASIILLSEAVAIIAR